MPKVNFDEWAQVRCRKCCWIGSKDRTITLRHEQKSRCPRCMSADLEIDVPITREEAEVNE